MLSNRILLKFSFALAVTLLFQSKLLAQSDKFTLTDDNIHKDDIVMTWNKNTPENEMKDDIKTLSEKGITIKYVNVKRNSNDEITAIKVDYSDRKGNKGTLEYNNQKPIPTIKFYKNGEEIGFGEPNSFNNMIAGDDFMNGFNNPQDLMKQFNFGKGDKNSQSFSFSFPNDGESLGQSKSKIMIQKDGKKPLVIEDGKVTEGGDDYTPEELEKIKSENKVERFGNLNENGTNHFDLRNPEGLENYKKQMQKMQDQMNDLMPNNNSLDNSKSDLEETKKEMLKAKEEMIKAREELEKAKKEVEKSKVKLKTQKA
jgi:hypothetical protein